MYINIDIGSAVEHSPQSIITYFCTQVRHSIAGLGISPLFIT